MAEKIQNVLGIQAELIPGARGMFDVQADKKLIFSKAVTGKFPDENAVIELLRTHNKT